VTAGTGRPGSPSELPRPRTPAGRAGIAALLDDPAGALLALDYDGTLAPIAADPERARVEVGAREAVAGAARVFGTVAIVTGRGAAQAVRIGAFEAVPGMVVLGHYGLQRWSNGRLDSPEPAPGVATARRRLPTLLTGAPEGVAVEDKTHSLAIHTRRATDPAAAFEQLREPLGRLASDSGLELVAGRFILELRPPGTDKGGALHTLVAERAARAVLFAGDDLGDLPAYEAVEAMRGAGVPGVTVCSASTEVSELARRADLVVNGPSGVVELLAALGKAAAGRRK
jgi:trehalose 6-phosphate phosphatase